MADETNDTTTGGTASSVPAQGASPVPTPAPLSGAGVSFSGADVGLTAGAPVADPRPIQQTPEEPVPDVGLLRPTQPGQAVPKQPASPPSRDDIVLEPGKAPLSSSDSQAVVPPPRPATFPAGNDAMQADIQKILGSIKLPERRGPQQDKAPQKQIPVVPVEEHLAKPAQQEPAKEGEQPIVVPLHTLKDDIQHVVRVDKMSLVRAASLEEDRKIKDASVVSEGAKQRSSRTRLFLFMSALLVLLGLAALGGVALVYMEQHQPASAPDTSSIIFAEQNLLLPIDGISAVSLKQQIAQLRTGQVGSLGSIVRIIPTIRTTDGTDSRPATTQEFLSALNLPIPDELLRALGSQFFFGMHSADKNAPVFVIQVLAYDHAFAGMLAWERGMNGDLAPIFTPVAIYKTGADGIPHERLFEDAVIRNYDARTLTDDTGTIQLYYSFPSPEYLVIAESPYTFAEVLNRLRAQRRL